MSSEDQRHNNNAACSVARHWAYRNLTATAKEIDEQTMLIALGYFADPDLVKQQILKVFYDAAREY